MEDTRLELSFSELVAAFNSHLIELNYSGKSLERYHFLAKHLIAFAKDELHTDHLTEELIERYIEHLKASNADGSGRLSEALRRRITFVRKFSEFCLRGSFQRCSVKSIPVPWVFQTTVDAYLAYLRDRGYAAATIDTRSYIKEFLHFLVSVGVSSCSEITPRHLSDYVVSQAHKNSGTMSIVLVNLRAFVRFLYLNRLHSADLSGEIPKLRFTPRHLPSAWTREEVEKLLSAVDRGNPTGKRDYAMLLLAAHLGMRVGDIRSLRLESLHWDTRRIVFTQGKTGREASLPILSQVGEAIIEYLRYGRPPTTAPEVFVMHTPPFAPFSASSSISSKVGDYCRYAGIEIPPGKRHGMHSLRHTLASALLGQHTPLTTISEILGHLNVHSTRVYLTIDVAALRQCALDPEEVINEN